MLESDNGIFEAGRRKRDESKAEERLQKSMIETTPMNYSLNGAKVLDSTGRSSRIDCRGIRKTGAT